VCREIAGYQDELESRIRLTHVTSFLSSLLLISAVAVTSSAQTSRSAPPSESSIALNKGAFAAGERLTYDVRFGRLHVGHGTMLLAGTDTVRGHTAWRAIFTISGGT